MLSSSSGAGVLVGACTILGGATLIAFAISTRLRRGEIAATYRSSGGIVYTIIQLGCGGVMTLFGIGIIILGLVTRGHV